MKVQIPAFETGRVLVVGDIMLDRYWHGGTARISPEAPVPVVHVKETHDRPGGAANVAVNLASLGARAHLLGITGNDEAADLLTEQLERHGVRHELVRLDAYPTITKLRVISRNQQLIRLDFEDALLRYERERLLAPFRRLLEDVDVVLLSDYGKGTLGDARDLISLARAAGKPVLVDPKGKDFGIYHGASLITPNLGEFEAVAGSCAGQDEILSKGRALAAALELDAILVTQGEEGMTLVLPEREPLHLAARAREVFDVTGAGDTVISVMGASMACGLALTEAMTLANAAAGIVVGKLGTASVTPAELRRALFEAQHHGRGVVDEDTLAQLVADARVQGETVVMTNGCFDILHAGHVAYLKQAASLGQRLIVAVNDDASVRRLKGASRPINPLAQRMAVLAALESVDWVLPFTEDTPERLICRLGPDVLVKGGDYRPEEIAGAGCVRERGGSVVVLDFVDGCSTSGIVSKIKQTETG